MNERIWETRFRVSLDNQDELLGICEGYSEVDETFTFEVRGMRPSFVVIFSNDMKQAFRRGMSIKRKLVGHGLEPRSFKLVKACNAEVDSF